MDPDIILLKYSRVLIEVIPFGGSIDNRWLTYFARDELAPDIQVGCLVEVPFRNAVDYAVVTSIASGEIPESPRSIVRIVTSTPLLAPYQIRSIFDCSSYYIVHAHQILSLFLSKTLVKYLEKKDFIWLNISLSTQERGGWYFLPSPPKERGWGWGEKEWVYGEWNNPDSAINFYHHTDDTSFFSAIQEHANLPSPSKGEGLGVRQNTVIVFPDDFSIEAYLTSCPIDPETTLVVPDKLTETKRHRAFCSVYNGEKNIIIWTRRILYYNLSRYENILYIEDSLHKTAMRFGHSYKHLEILRRMAPQSGFRIAILSTLPSIESMYLLHTGVYRKW